LISRGARKAVDLLNDPGYLVSFNENLAPNDEVVLSTYKIYFQLIKHVQIINVFENKNEFWKEVCNYFNSDPKQKAGNILAKVIRKSN